MSFTTLIVMLVICVCYIVMTQSAGNEGNWNYPGTPRPDHRITKRMMESRQQENVGSSSSREIRKKGRADEGSSSARGRSRRSEKTEVELQPGPETAKNPSKLWTNEELYAILRLAFITSGWKGPNHSNTFDWRLIESGWNKNWVLKFDKAMRTRLVRLLSAMENAGWKFDGKHRYAPWHEGYGHNLLKIYFNTEDGDKAEHGKRILAGWKRMSFPIHEGITPEYLLARAEAMLHSVMKFDINNPRGRTTMLKSNELVDWKPEQDEYFRHLLLEHPYNEANRMENVFNEALRRYEGLRCIGLKKLYEHLWEVCPTLLVNHEIKGPVGESSHATPHIQYHSFMGDYNFTPLSLENHPYYDGMAGASSHPVQSYDQPDLNLRLNSLHVRERSPDTELKLGYPPHRGSHY